MAGEKTDGGDQLKHREQLCRKEEEKNTYTAEAFMIYNGAHTAFAVIPHLTAWAVIQ